MSIIKIAYFIDRIIVGGTELQLVEQINRLEGNGVKQILFCLYKNAEHDKIPINCNTEILNIRSLAKLDTLKKMRTVVRLLKKEEIDIVQTYFFDSTIIGVLCAAFARIKKVVSCRRDLGFWYTAKVLLVLKFINKFTDRILVNSVAVKRNVVRLEKVNISKIDVINNGIDVQRYWFDNNTLKKSFSHLPAKDDEFCVGIIANMSREVKRVDLFIESARILISRGFMAKFFILGDGCLRQNLEHMKKAYGLDDHVFFLGRNYSKEKLLSVIKIGVITSDSEGLSNAIMEYMASGIPTIASNVAGNRELIRDNENGYVFKKGSAEDLANKISYFTESKDRWRQLGSQAAQDILKFDWSNRIPEILDYYHSLLNQKR